MARTESENSRTFYDEHPFDRAPPGPQESMRSVVSPLLADLIERIDLNSLVFDVGCGPGRVLSFLTRRGIRCVGIDRSHVSLGLAKQRFGAPGVVADTPRVAFLSRAVIEGWSAKHGSRIVLYDENRSANVHSFCLMKQREAHVADVLAEPKKGAE
jgi:SAM-dependent methyltransferase